MSTEPDQLSQSGTERVVVWHMLRHTSPEVREQVEVWTQQAMTRVEVAGGALLAVVGGSLACSFDSVELDDAIELCASLCRDAAVARPQLDLCCGIAFGEVLCSHGRGPVAVRFGGACIDRAQLMAHRGGSGDVLLDEAAHERAAEHYLFSAAVQVGGRGCHVLDATHPRRRDCREAQQHLAAPIIAPGQREEFERLQRYLTAPGPQRVIVQSESRFHVLEWLDRLTQALSPTVLLRLRQQASGLQPLGGLQAAMRGRFPDDAAVEASSLDDACKAHARALLSGAALGRNDAVELLTAVLAAQRGRRGWLMLDRVHDVDAASLGVVAEVLGRAEADVVAILCVAPGATVPAALTAGGSIHECSLRPLGAADAQAIAAAVLRLPVDSPVARRVAAIGGPSTIGVLEAARTLVVSGDLVFEEGAFGWRTEARAGGGGVPVDALFTERVHGLDHDAYRLLEVLSITAPGASLEFNLRVAEADGMSVPACQSALSWLQREGLSDERGMLGAAEASVRNAMRNNMPPARAAELHRFAAAVMRQEPGPGPLGAALLAYHLSEGGVEADAAQMLLDAAKATSDAGFQRMSVRMAAVAVQFDASDATRQQAHGLARSLSTPGRELSDAPPAPGTSPSPLPEDAESGNVAERAIRRAVGAMCAADYESVERWLDTAVVAGWDPAATRRLRALSQLARGDQAAAIHTLQSAHATGDAAATREALCWALLHLGAGEIEEAMCASLSALATSRRAGDADGEGTSLHLLAACYEALDRPEDAGRLRQTAEA